VSAQSPNVRDLTLLLNYLIPVICLYDENYSNLLHYFLAYIRTYIHRHTYIKIYIAPKLYNEYEELVQGD